MAANVAPVVNPAAAISESLSRYTERPKRARRLGARSFVDVAPSFGSGVTAQPTTVGASGTREP
jgi:hypothetical protein